MPLPSTGTATAPPDAAEAEKRFRALAGVPIGFPRDDVDFVPVEVRRETFANHPAASLRFRYAGEEYLLVVSARDRLLGTPSVAAFPEGSFVSGERDGRSFVLWEREEASCIVVSEVDVTRRSTWSVGCSPDPEQNRIRQGGTAMNVAKRMKRNPVFVDEGDSMKKAMDLLKEHEIRRRRRCRR